MVSTFFFFHGLCFLPPACVTQPTAACVYHAATARGWAAYVSTVRQPLARCGAAAAPGFVFSTTPPNLTDHFDAAYWLVRFFF